MAELKIEEKYRELSEIDHILLRPGMHVGSTKEERKVMFLFSHDERKMEQHEIIYIPALMKIMDEVISNSCDEFRRPENLGLNELHVRIWKNGDVIIEDNGGIPVVMHKDAGCYLPEFIFGRFRTSSNYNDSEDRNVVGTNGVGSKLANVYSKNFTIYTADGKNSYQRTWKNNMREICDDMILKPCSDHFTKTSFTIDFSKFDTEETEFTDDFIDAIEKRCIDAAAANPGLKVYFYVEESSEVLYHSEWLFKNFEEYIELYSDYVDLQNCISFKTDKQQVWVYPDGQLNIGFVNGAECSQGTHITSLRSDINNAVAKVLMSKHQVEVSSRTISGMYSLFCCVQVSNPSYSSQTKEKLDTPADRFDKNLKKKYVIPIEFITKIENSEIIHLVLDWYKQKKIADDKKTTRRLNKQLKLKVRNQKFIDANSKHREERELWLFEGDSAKSGFRVARNPQTQGAYILRGVPKNVMGLSPAQQMKNQELSDIMTVLGLQWGQKNDVKKLRFSKIVIATDADHDGDKIAGILLVFLSQFPELFEAQMVCRSMSPIMTAVKGSDVIDFYSFDEYEKRKNDLEGYHIKYTKGLGGLSDKEYKKMMREPIFHYFRMDDLAEASLRSWFGRGIAHERRNMLKNEV